MRSTGDATESIKRDSYSRKVSVDSGCPVYLISQTKNDKTKAVVTADERGFTVDRHALRTTFVSWLGAYGVDHRAQIALARHARTGVTLKHFLDVKLLDL